ncbi:MAG: CreA family protein [Turicimonas muris]
MKTMLKLKSVLLLAGAAVLAAGLSGCSDENVGSVSLGILTLKDIKISAFQDRDVPGVTCHVASIDSPLTLSDPSDASVSCVQTGEITPEMIENVKRNKTGEVVFKQSKSVFLKTLKIKRIFDEKNQTLMYIAYTTKEFNGSFKNSLSTISLWRTKAYNPAIAAENQN